MKFRNSESIQCMWFFLYFQVVLSLFCKLNWWNTASNSKTTDVQLTEYCPRLCSSFGGRSLFGQHLRLERGEHNDYISYRSHWLNCFNESRSLWFENCLWSKRLSCTCRVHTLSVPTGSGFLLCKLLAIIMELISSIWIPYTLSGSTNEVSSNQVSTSTYEVGASQAGFHQKSTNQVVANQVSTDQARTNQLSTTLSRQYSILKQVWIKLVRIK